jgi:hypothetical protein
MNNEYETNDASTSTEKNKNRSYHREFLSGGLPKT